jgi:hypothetical protein
MIRNQKSFKSRKIRPLVLTLSVLAVLSMQQTQQAYAQQPNGYNAGKNDRMDGLQYNDTCPPELSGHGDCLLYKAGYRLGWAAESLTHGNDEARATEPDYSNRDDTDGDGDDN